MAYRACLVYLLHTVDLAYLAYSACPDYWPCFPDVTGYLVLSAKHVRLIFQELDIREVHRKGRPVTNAASWQSDERQR